MNLVLDIGNTNTKLAIFQNNKMIKHIIVKRLSLISLKKMIKNYSIKNICCSYTGSPFDWIANFCKKKQIKYLKLDSRCNLPIKLDYQTPKTLGSDRIALCVGAHMKYPGNKLIIDLGTCLTYDMIVDDVYLGGRISPGFAMRLLSLHQKTHGLPKLTPKKTDLLIGKTTKDSILLGVYDGLILEIEGVIQKYKSRYSNILVILTGGDLQFF